MFDASSRILSKTRTSAGTFCRATGVVFLLLLTSGCGVVGDILPPALNLPMRATDMVALEHDKLIIVTFKLPATTTEGTLIRHPPEIDLRIGPAPADPNDDKGWAAHAKRIPTTEPHGDTLVAPWVNQKVAISVRLLNEHGKDAGWSPLVFLTVVPPVETPKDLTPESQPNGVHLKWISSAPKFRIYRHLPSGPGYEQVATTEKPEYDDAVDFGKEYSYYVQALAPAGDGMAESDNSAIVNITPKDIFPPAAPVGLAFILGGKTVELTWTRNTETDLAGYRVYRAFENNGFERINDTQESTSFSDRNIEPGKHYRYAVTAVDRAGNEGKMSEPVTVAAP
jgi:hypothetical protein